MVADELVEILQRIWGRQHWGVLMELLLRHAALATMAFGGSIADSARLLEDPAFRERKLAEVHDPATQRFFQQLGAAGGLDRRLLPAVHRLQRLLASPLLRNILSQPANAVDYGRVFAAGESLLFDLSGIGAGNAKLLGSLLLLQVRQGAMNRDLASASLQPHVVLVDEASWFLSSTVAELFDQARKFGVGLVLAVQRGGQLAPEDVRNAVLANVGSLAVWRVHDHDEASLFARHLGGDRVSAYDLQHLPRYEAYLQTIGDGERHEPAWFRPLPPASERSLDGESELLKRGRELYSRPRQVVEEALGRRDASTSDDDPEILTIADPDPDDGFPADAA